MAKRGKPGRVAGSAQKTFDRVLASIPARAEFSMTMDADSTVEVWDDIDTNLQDGEAWLVYGGVFTFENIEPTQPAWGPADSSDNCYTLQVHRNDDSELLLNFLDDDVMYHWGLHRDIMLNVQGASMTDMYHPFRFGHRTITFSEKLRVIFRSATNDNDLGLVTKQLVGYLLYDRILAPSIGQSKLGQIADL